MTDAERKSIEKYVKEVFHYEHDLSAVILARLLLLCELLIEKNILKEEDVMNKLSDVNVAEMLQSMDYNDKEWNDDEINL